MLWPPTRQRRIADAPHVLPRGRRTAQTDEWRGRKSVGFKIGGSSTDLIMSIMSERGADKLLKNAQTSRAFVVLAILLVVLGVQGDRSWAVPLLTLSAR